MSSDTVTESNPSDQVSDHAPEAAYLVPDPPLTLAQVAAVCGRFVVIRLLENDYHEDWRVDRIREDARAAAHYGIAALSAMGRW